jgi:rfaE bifunctional protein nucleotidyltransferase chain/domain
MRESEPKSQRVVFTNGCFDLLHPGHVDLLKKARALGSRLIVGINSDRSVRAIKGSPRPFLDQEARAAILSELRAVDEVRIFDENTPERLIREIQPDVLVKGGDWLADQIVGADFVLQNGGEVFSIPFEKDFSTTKIADRIKEGEKKKKRVFSERGPELKEKLEVALEKRSEFWRVLPVDAAQPVANCADMMLEKLRLEKRVYFCGDADSGALLEYFSAVMAKKMITPERGKGRIVFVPDPQNRSLDGAENTPLENNLLLAFSPGGNSEEILSLVMKAREANCRTCGFSGRGGKRLASLCDLNVSFPSETRAEILEGFFAVGNILIDLINQESGF